MKKLGLIFLSGSVLITLTSCKDKQSDRRVSQLEKEMQELKAYTHQLQESADLVVEPASVIEQELVAENSPVTDLVSTELADSEVVIAADVPDESSTDVALGCGHDYHLSCDTEGAVAEPIAVLGVNVKAEVDNDPLLAYDPNDFVDDFVFLEEVASISQPVAEEVPPVVVEVHEEVTVYNEYNEYYEYDNLPYEDVIIICDLCWKQACSCRSGGISSGKPQKPHRPSRPPGVKPPKPEHPIHKAEPEVKQITLTRPSVSHPKPTSSDLDSHPQVVKVGSRSKEAKTGNLLADLKKLEAERALRQQRERTARAQAKKQKSSQRTNAPATSQQGEKSTPSRETSTASSGNTKQASQRQSNVQSVNTRKSAANQQTKAREDLARRHREEQMRKAREQQARKLKEEERRVLQARENRLAQEREQREQESRQAAAASRSSRSSQPAQRDEPASQSRGEQARQQHIEQQMQRRTR